MGKLIKPLGILTFLLLTSSIILGLLVPRRRKPLFRVHRWIALATIAAAACHAAIILSLD